MKPVCAPGLSVWRGLIRGGPPAYFAGRGRFRCHNSVRGGRAFGRGPTLDKERQGWGTRRRYCGYYLMVKVRGFDFPPPGVGFLTTISALPADAMAAAVT